MLDGDIVVLTGRDVLSLLEGREAEVIRTVGAAYEAHAEGHSSLPHSIFLRFPDERTGLLSTTPLAVVPPTRPFNNWEPRHARKRRRQPDSRGLD